MTDCCFITMTGPLPGAIGIIQLHGEVHRLLYEVTGIHKWPVGRSRLVCLRDIDEGLVVRLDDAVAQVMPHGGPRVKQRLQALLEEIGAKQVTQDDVPPAEVYPEAEDAFEAIALLTLSRATSPMAIDLLLEQPEIWRATTGVTDADRRRSERLNHLIDPPLVVLAGPPNVGKSTLSNALLGRSMSIAVDMPGTTRDYTAARIELSGLVVKWHDTPGLRETGDAIEAKSIELARRLMEQADLLLAITDAEHDWPTLPREPDMRIASKQDVSAREDADVLLSAATGEGIKELVRLVRDRLLPPDDLAAAKVRPWVFDPRLQRDT